ncbi:MAG: hypothetical protein JEZ03_15930 [Bacteroidales bacterium]|nr:hypothetical protein [Bacteroidales bacterium]
MLKNRMQILLFFISTVLIVSVRAQYNPEAGNIESYTDHASISLSSNENELLFVDGNQSTYWQSESPLPEKYLRRKELNLLLNHSGIFQASSNADLSMICDGDLQNNVIIGQKGVLSWVEISFDNPVEFLRLSLKMEMERNTNLYYRDQNNKLFHVSTLSKEDDYQLKAIELPGKFVRKIRLESSTAFKVFEIGFLKEQIFESIVFDFFQEKKIAWISSRHLTGNGDVERIEVLGSNNLKQWELVTELDPDYVGLQNVILAKELEFQFVKYVFRLKQKDYSKANLWEVDVYDHFGPYGRNPADKPSKQPLKNLMGVNVFWGMGKNTYSDQQGDMSTSVLLADVFTHIRSYHNMDWDVNSPQQRPDYISKTNGRGIGSMPWLNWDKEYEYWANLGFGIQACIQFPSAFNDPVLWGDAYQNAYNYSFEFCRHFGVSYGNKTVKAIEVGNEPWEMPNELYLKVLAGMIQGAKDADPVMEIFPCALRSGVNVIDNLDYLNKTDQKLNAELASRIDGMNCHYYSYFRGADQLRAGVWPEHPGSSFRGILNELKYRDQNFPSKPIILGEFGWDSNGGGEDCTHDECVDEYAQAMYAVRSYLILSRLGIQRGYWFFYANEDKYSTQYSRSGLFSSVNHEFKEKPVFHALKSMRKQIGDLYFQKVIEESETAYCYQFGDENGKATHLVVWRPQNAEDYQKYSYAIPENYKIQSSMLLDGKQQSYTTVHQIRKNEVRISVSPLVLKLAD